MGKRRGSQRPKQGKNKKKSWRQIQHNDVNKYLDEVREDERLGGIQAKPDEELFAIDDLSFAVTGGSKVAGDEKAALAPKSRQSDTGPLVKIDDLKCFRLLKPHTSVPDPVVKRNPLRKRGARKSLMMELKDERRRSKRVVTVTEPKEKCNDPWAMVEPKTILDSEWIDSSIRRINLRPRPKPVGHVTSELPAIETPHPGFSYNPSFQDHQNLLQQAVIAAKSSIRKERNLIKAIAPTVCLTVEKSESESENEDMDEFLQDIKPTLHKSKAKTKQQKRKEREEKEKTRLLQQKKRNNIRLNEVFRIKTIQKQINKSEKKQKDRLKKAVEKSIAEKKFGQKDISKFKYEELTLDPALSDEIQGTLIGIPAQNRLVLERFKSLQKRNIVEPRIKQRMKRKLRVKKFQKAIDKMEWEKTGHWNGIRVTK